MSEKSLSLTRSDTSADADRIDEHVERILKALGVRVPPKEGAYPTDPEIHREIPELSETILSSEQAWEGTFLKVDDVEVELPNGDVVHHDVIRHPGAVAVIAIDADNRVLLVNQYRTALERMTLEIPAGKLEPGEEVMDCVRRELEEETGYTAQNISYLIPIATAAGYSDEIIHLFLATGLEAGAAHPDPDEFIASQWMALSDLIDLVLDGKIEDSKTVIAALACDAIARRL